MIQKFEDIRTNPARALQAYLVLIGAASNRQTLTYGDLADKLNFKGAGVLGHILGHIMYWCRDHDVPSLTSLIVNQTTGLPGEGLSEPANLNSERERIYGYDWYAIIPPTIDELETGYAGRNRSDRGQ